MNRKPNLKQETNIDRTPERTVWTHLYPDIDRLHLLTRLTNVLHVGFSAEWLVLLIYFPQFACYLVYALLWQPLLLHGTICCKGVMKSSWGLLKTILMLSANNLHPYRQCSYGLHTTCRYIFRIRICQEIEQKCGFVKDTWTRNEIKKRNAEEEEGFIHMFYKLGKNVW